MPPSSWTSMADTRGGAGEEPPPIPLAPTAAPAGERGRSPYAPPPGQATTGQPTPGQPPLGGGMALPEIAKPPLDGPALSSVITGALGLGPVALALGAVGLRRTRRSWRRSPRLAWIGIGLGAAATLVYTLLGLVWAAGGGFGIGGGSGESGDVAEPVVVHASRLAVGNCISHLPPDPPVGEVSLVPCAQAHAAQVVALVDIEHDDDTYPGEASALAFGEEACTAPAQAVDLAGAGLRPDGVRPWWFAPSERGWDAGTRHVVCLVRTTGAALEDDLLG